ncbi:hypothetical protein [Pseudonocardia endophytica]|uniref:Uncharacterized protein n=1 Tax=Pseudonocardia endophytica TaxID=401976 RepID=A0A4R1HUX5_PSEEN|nr:hypothetical protein [Pseudonocardia endophytica]TCK24470.1 hypothetical protein EV378_0242 [Pseudonocardia endophytica]
MTTTTTPTGLSAPVRALQATTTLVLLVLAWQFVTAGQMIPRGGPEELHAAGAIVLHVASGLAVVAAFLLNRTARGPWWPTVLTAVVFVLTFVQAYTGSHGVLAVHVPCAIVLTVGSVWVAAWSWLGSTASARRR